MIKQTLDSYGYKKRLVYKKADELQSETSLLTTPWPPLKTLLCPSGYRSLLDQMQRSSRSTKQDIVEGWKRNSTSEYYTFLGYSVASNAELEEGYSDITGKYSELMGKKEIMGEKGEIKEVEKLSFYPLDTHLPPIIQLKLRCKEVNFLLDRLQKSLVSKMEKDHNLSQKDCMKQGETQKEKEDKWPRTVLKRIAFCYNFKTFRHLKLIRN